MTRARFTPYEAYREYSPEQMQQRAVTFRDDMRRRRTVRQFSPRPVDRSVVEDCIAAAGTAPSGANLQPWHFVVVEDPAVKRRIREASERVEREFYERRASSEFLENVSPVTGFTCSSYCRSGL